jgi:predicted dehydrogenase
MKKTYKWGILGAGKIAEKFATAIAYTPGAELYAIASRDKKKGQDFATRHSVSAVFNDYESLAMDTEVDVIYIATPHAFHCEHSILCLENNKPVVCEKPMALSYAQLVKMIGAAREHNVFFMEGMWSRFMPTTHKTLELIKQDVIGDVQYVRAAFGFNAPADENNRLYNLKLGGGSLLDVGIYPLFLATLLLGEPASIHTASKLTRTGADEYCNALLKYSGDRSASIFSSITMDTEKDAEIIGSKGKIILQTPWYKATEMLVLLNDGDKQSFSMPHGSNGFEHEIAHVMDCLDKGYKESPLLPFDFTSMMSRTMDIILHQMGVVYEIEN